MSFVFIVLITKHHFKHLSISLPVSVTLSTSLLLLLRSPDAQASITAEGQPEWSIDSAQLQEGHDVPQSPRHSSLVQQRSTTRQVGAVVPAFDWS